MSKMIEQLVATLQTDAKLAAAGTLGVLLNQASTNPYGIFFHGPPKVPTYPLITQYPVGGMGEKPEILYHMITAYGAGYGDILTRVRVLLHRQPRIFEGAVDFHVISIKHVWTSPDVIDPDSKEYTQSHRYEIQGWRR